MATVQEETARLKDYILTRLIETGQRDRLKDLLRTRLNESGWRDEIKDHCQSIFFAIINHLHSDVIRQKGLDNLTVDDLVTEITPVGRKKVPDFVKKELLQEITAFLTKETDSTS
ncbi:Transcription and mRNA export factor eny2 [Cichlidogyrus casuarinus]|uniref:Transcription and mRNA export factor ENY2 n=1 Tax=Cichlidogyrus casuarinus TaxID=1844966 RepID=A0ABD2QP37_9PLAT